MRPPHEGPPGPGSLYQDVNGTVVMTRFRRTGSFASSFQASQSFRHSRQPPPSLPHGDCLDIHTRIPPAQTPSLLI